MFASSALKEKWQSTQKIFMGPGLKIAYTVSAHIALERTNSVTQSHRLDSQEPDADIEVQGYTKVIQKQSL